MKRPIVRPRRKPARKSPHPPPTSAPAASPPPAAGLDWAEVMPSTGGSSFPVVGLGASAGGLEALEQFFRHVPGNSGMAYVVVSHLDPSRESILTEIVQRATTLPTVEATDQQLVEPDHIYVIPPNRDLTIFHGALQLSVPEAPRGQRLPIDGFFRSLAEDQGERAIAAVLSGTGSDGTLGLRAILGAGGVTFAQELATARYDGMPASAIRGGYVSQVLPVELMPEAMRKAARASGVRVTAPTTTTSLHALSQILASLRARTGHDFSLYKRSTVVRRIERRMLQHDLASLDDYARYLKQHPDEVQVLFRELLINVTSFFRDPAAFEALRTEALPALLEGKAEGSTLRVWVAGCATGEEAYSIAMLLRELIDHSHLDLKLQLYATDLDDDAVARARAGVYPFSIVQDVTAERLRRFFAKEEAAYRVKKELREMVVFAVQNVIKDPPFTRLDLISCRNLMIYLQPEAQDRLLSTFHYALRPGGVLFLSPSESTGQHVDQFKPLSRSWTIFRAVPAAGSSQTPLPLAPARPGLAEGETPGSRPTPGRAPEANIAELTARALLRSFAPASVATDPAGTILFVHGDTGPYLRTAPGLATLNVMEMARGELQFELRAAYRGGARRADRSLTREVLVTDDGRRRRVRLSLLPLGPRQDGGGLLLVSFEELPPGPPPARAGGKGKAGPVEKGRIPALERALADARELWRTTVEEQQASTEELKSMNEELQSTNEELQSTNEEMETSKEELQSVNEELVTVNAELQSKMEQLAETQGDMRNLLDSVSAGTVFLDTRLCIRRFTREATRAFRLVPTDLGRPLLDIKNDLTGLDLAAAAGRVLESLVPWEQEVQTPGGASYLIRLHPYRTLENVIDGVVVSLNDVTARVKAETAAQESRLLAESIVDTVREPLVVLDRALRVIAASRSFFAYFQVAPEETVGRLIFELGNRQWDVPALRQLLETTLLRDQVFEGYMLTHDFPRIGPRRLVLNARRIVGEGGVTQRILLAIEDKGGA